MAQGNSVTETAERFTLGVSELIDDAPNLNCDNANVSALAQYYGLEEPSAPVGCQWHYALPEPGELPGILRVPTLSAFESRAGLVFERTRLDVHREPERARELVRKGVPVLVYGNQYNMKWVPYYRHEVASHPFILDGLGPGGFHALEAYLNTSDWGISAPTQLWITDEELTEAVATLEGPLHGVAIHLSGRRDPERVDAVEDIRTNAAGILRGVGEEGGLAAFSKRYRDQATDPQAMKLYDLSCWELTRSRSCHLRWLRLRSAQDERIPADLVDRFEAELVGPWRRALQFAHLGYKRVESGALPPMVSFDLIENDIAAAETALAHEMLERIAG
jgi:hypothetical protein